MTIPFPWYLKGTVTDGGAVEGATVRARDITVDQGIATATTDSSGKYLINLMNYATHGHTVEVWCAANGKYKRNTFVVNTYAPGQTEDLTLEALEYTETVTLFDGLTKLATVVKTLSETTTLTDELTRIVIVVRMSIN